jgi:integrase
LFLKPAADGDVEGPRKGLTNRLSEFVRSDVGVVDPVVQPNHGWRHRFKTLSRRYGLDRDVVKAIQGHAGAETSEEYGDSELEAMALNIDRIPRIVVEDTRRGPAGAQ